MKPYQVHIIKSERIARARLGRPLTNMLASRKQEKQKLAACKFAKQTYRTGHKIQKHDLSNTTSDSGKRRRRRKRFGTFNLRRRRRSQKLLENSILSKQRDNSGSDSESEETPEPAHNGLQKIPVIIEDGQPWTQEEIKYFENVFGDKLFDNTIDTGPGFQASLENLNSRSFKSYKKQCAGVFADQSRHDVLLTLVRGRRILENSGQSSATNSGLIRLLSFFQTQEAFFDFLKTKTEMLNHFFEKADVNDKRKWIK